MRNRPSSSPADCACAPWYREPWPWLLIAGPLTVVLASLVTTWLAVRSDDGVVAGDYYKRGLLVNQQLPKVPVVMPHRVPRVELDGAGHVRLRVEGDTPNWEAVRVTLVHPASGARETVTLGRNAAEDWTGTLAANAPGRWIATFEPGPDALPTTIVARVATLPSTAR